MYFVCENFPSNNTLLSQSTSFFQDLRGCEKPSVPVIFDLFLSGRETEAKDLGKWESWYNLTRLGFE